MTFTKYALAITLAFTGVGAAAAQTATVAATPAATPGAPGNAALKAPHAMRSTLTKGHNSFTRGQARKRMQKAGYTSLTGFSKDKDGVWHAHGMKDGAQAEVAMDYQGNVSSN